MRAYSALRSGVVAPAERLIKSRFASAGSRGRVSSIFEPAELLRVSGSRQLPTGSVRHHGGVDEPLDVSPPCNFRAEPNASQCARGAVECWPRITMADEAVHPGVVCSVNG